MTHAVELNDPELVGASCPSCLPVVHEMPGRGIAGPVTTISVTHGETCAWAETHVPPDGFAVIMPPDTIVLHHRDDDSPDDAA